MAEKKFSELTAKGATIADTDIVAISESAGGGTYTSKSVTGANIKALVTDANMTTTDITTNDVSTSKHGFAPKAPNDATKFLDGTGAYDTVKDSDLSLSDITTNNVSTTQHGFVPKAPNNTTTFLRGDGTWATPAAGGLTKFTEAEATTSPNNTVYVDSLTAAGSTTNVDVAIVPKGTGAFMLDIPDGTTTGGNKRGANAIDMQSFRNNAGEVASGAGSFCGGVALTASGSYAVSLGVGNVSSGILGSFSVGYLSNASGESSAAIGSGNTSSGAYSFSVGSGNTSSAETSISIGKSNSNSGIRSCALGVSNSVTGQEAIAIGIGNTASGQYSFAIGANSSTFGIIGRQSYASIQEATVGDAQASKFVLHERTTNATATTLTTNSGAASTNNQVILSNQSAYRFKGTIIGKQSGSTNTSAWDVDGLIVRGANAAATTLLISNVTLVQNTPAWGTPTLAADTTNGGLQVQVTGAAATNIQWTAVIETTEVIYA
jgi:hypothetical protein